MKMLMLLLCGLSMVVKADIFDDPQNLEVLDKDISPQKLQAIMKSFSMSLGVRCQHCHVGEEGKPLTEFDFAADDKEAKKKARFMLNMVHDINKGIENKMPDSSIQVKCMTCHRGAARPIQTVDLLNNTYADKGVDDALAKYDELKANYYGSHTYDFTEKTLVMLATKMFAKDPAASVKTLQKNLSQYPKGVQTLVKLGELYAAQKNWTKALEYFNQANDIKPNPWIAQRIKALKEQL